MMTFNKTLQESAACGVGLIVNLPSSMARSTRQLVVDGVQMLSSFEYRSGIHPVTDESDGAGVRLFGLSEDFFNQLITKKQFRALDGSSVDATLEAEQFAVGQYFFLEPKHDIPQHHQWIAELCQQFQLKLLGWRSLEHAVDLEQLSVEAQHSMPSLWQCIIVAQDLEQLHFEKQVQKANIAIIQKAAESQFKIHVASQSSQSIVYKGMIKASRLGLFYHDLQDESFKAYACIQHARYATNTSPQWANAQPCSHVMGHNGEFNSAPANAIEMKEELTVLGFQGIYPRPQLSDSMQIDSDLFNLMQMWDIPLHEAILRLIPPTHLDDPMLESFRKIRSPYNGPAFIAAGHDKHFMIKLDDCGLRPSRWALLEWPDGTQQFQAASHDAIALSPHYKVLKKAELDSGGMLLIKPDGRILQTSEIIQDIKQSYTEQFFEHLYQSSSKVLSVQGSQTFELPDDLNQKLYASGWDYETVEQVLLPTAKLGAEPTAAMGDDTHPLHAGRVPGHISYFFHQLFAQVSAPAIDSIRERSRFRLQTWLGPKPIKLEPVVQFKLDSPILTAQQFNQIETQKSLLVHHIDLCIELSLASPSCFQDKLFAIMQEAHQAVAQGASILVLSDKTVSTKRVALPDLLAVAAVRQHLEQHQLMHLTSISVDSMQITGPHQVSALLAMGAQVVFARGVHYQLQVEFKQQFSKAEANVNKAYEKCLLKTMGKMGITDVSNYINGKFIAALGLDLEPVADASSVSLSSIFKGFYSPLRGFNLGHISDACFQRHQQAFHAEYPFFILPRSGIFMPEKHGIEHGYGPQVIDAVSSWMKHEEVKSKLYQMHCILEKRGYPNYLTDLNEFTPQTGFLNPIEKQQGAYPLEYLEQFKSSEEFHILQHRLNDYRIKHPTCIRDHFKLINCAGGFVDEVQSQASIRQVLFGGSMSQGALTVSQLNTPDKPGAHETLTMGLNAVHAMSASGEGGEAPSDLRHPMRSTRSKQIASGRFGISAMQIQMAKEMEIKIAQGAKPGEGGELPGQKVSIRFAAQRGGLPGTTFISPPPHHDIYSIEDLEQLIRDIKTVNPQVQVAVKLVSSLGIGTIAVGVVKAGADVINIASNSGGTGAAQQSSIKHAGLPGELGLLEVDTALRKAKLRDLVQLRTSGGIKTAEDILISAIMGADQFELGTTSMLMLGCKMQRTCNKSCQPGVATDGHLFKGDQLHVERFFVNMASLIQKQLSYLGVSCLSSLKGRKDLITLVESKYTKHYDFSMFFQDDSVYPKPNSEQLSLALIKRQQKFSHVKELNLIADIKQFFLNQPDGTFQSDTIELNCEDLSFAAGIAGSMVHHLEQHPQAKIILNTKGVAGESFAFVLPEGMQIHHQGGVQDGAGKSMTGGELIIRSEFPDAMDFSVGGNSILYGANGGRAYIQGKVGHRFGILNKGAVAVVEGAGDLALEYMTAGTVMILGEVGRDLATGSSGGVMIVWDAKGILKPSADVERQQTQAYTGVIRNLLKEHHAKTGSMLAKSLLEDFQADAFTVLTPTALNQIQTCQQFIAVIQTYELRAQLLCPGMKVWLEQKIIAYFSNPENQDKQAFMQFLLHTKQRYLTSSGMAKCHKFNYQEQKLLIKQNDMNSHAFFHPPVQLVQPVLQRVSSILGELDAQLLDGLTHIKAYAGQLLHDASGCSGCKAQSCASGHESEFGCPSGKPINSINYHLKRLEHLSLDDFLSHSEWLDLRKAFELQIQESPFIAYTGAACPAPCQDACTESIPQMSDVQSSSSSKRVGEPVHIKNIEFYLFQIGRAMGWFDGQKIWTSDEIKGVFGDEEYKKLHYDAVMQQFSPAFQPASKKREQELIIIGSGPAAMQIAFEGLRDGLQVRMYEKSDKPGGLLMDGIPAHKFTKDYIVEDFKYLQGMGLILHLNSEVRFDKQRQQLRVDQQVIADLDNPNQMIAFCTGTGRPKSFSKSLLEQLDDSSKKKIVQAVDFLKAANDIASEIKAKSASVDLEALIQQKFAGMDPRHKKIVVVGGGDTAQDVIRWLVRYFQQTQGELNMLLRGPLPETARGIMDAYPHASKAMTSEHQLRHEELQIIDSSISERTDIMKIEQNAGQKLSIEISQQHYQYESYISSQPEMRRFFSELPREKRPIDQKRQVIRRIEDVDMIICALGFESAQEFHPSIFNSGRVCFAGDAALHTQKIIVAAQANAKSTYHGHLRKLIVQDKPSVLPFFSAANEDTLDASRKKLEF